METRQNSQSTTLARLLILVVAFACIDRAYAQDGVPLEPPTSAPTEAKPELAPGEVEETTEPKPSIDLIEALTPSNSTMYSNRGSVRARVGDIDGARQDFDKAIELDEKNADAFSGRGYLRIYAGDSKGALSDFESAIKADPKNTSALCGRGQVRSELGQEKEALADFDQAINLDPENAPSYVFRGYHLIQHGDKQKAIADYDKTIKLDPNNVLAYCYRGQAKEAIKDNKGAIADFTKVIKFDPEYAWAYYRRGAVHDDLGERTAAVSDFNQYIKLKPADPWGYRARGWTRHNSGNKKLAIQDYTKAISLDPTDPWTFSARGFERQKSGDTKGSVADYKKYSQLLRKKPIPGYSTSTSDSSTEKEEKITLITDADVYSFSAKTIKDAEQSFGPPKTPIKQLLLFHRPGSHCQTVLWDADKGIFCIFMANPKYDAYFHGNLGHELVHLLNAKLCDPYTEGLCSVFGEESLGDDQTNRKSYRDLLHATPFYKETYDMMKELESSIDNKTYSSILSFATYDAAEQWMHIDIDKWLDSLAAEDRTKATDIIKKYTSDIETKMPKDGIYRFAQPTLTP